MIDLSSESIPKQSDKITIQGTEGAVLQWPVRQFNFWMQEGGNDLPCFYTLTLLKSNGLENCILHILHLVHSKAAETNSAEDMAFPGTPVWRHDRQAGL